MSNGRNTAAQAQQTYQQRYYSHDGKPIFMHSLTEGYASFSNHQEDMIQSLPGVLKPFSSSKTVKVQVGINQVREAVTKDVPYARPDGATSIKREIVGERVVREDPIIERRRVNDTPDFQPLGTAIKTGDSVVLQRNGPTVRGVLEELNPIYVRIGEELHFWSQQNMLITRAA